MEDLTGRFTQALSPSSMSAGNTVYDSPELAMTAPGSPSVNSYAEVNEDVLPQPTFSGPQIPVSHPGVRDKVQAASARFGGATFDVITIGGVWNEV